MKLIQFVVAGAALASFGVVAADEPKQKQDSQAQSSQKQQVSQKHSPDLVKRAQRR